MTKILGRFFGRRNSGDIAQVIVHPRASAVAAMVHYRRHIMSIKQSLHQAVDALPESVTLEQAVKLKRVRKMTLDGFELEAAARYY